MRFLLFLMVILTQCGWQFPSGWQNDFPWQKCGNGSGCIISSPSTVNVGIGTTQSVPNKLYVVGDIFATGTISDGSGSVGPWTQSGTNVILTTNSNNVGIGNDTTPDASLEIITNGSVPPLAVSSTNVSAAGDRFLIDSMGNVGIGTGLVLNNLAVYSPNTTTGINVNSVTTNIGCDANTSLLVHANTNFSDSGCSAGPLTATPTGATIDTINFKFGPGSGHFTKSSDQNVDYGTGVAALSLGAGDGDYEAWVKLDSIGTTRYIAGSSGNAGAGATIGLQWSFDATNNMDCSFRASGGTIIGSVTSSTTLTDTSSFHDIVCERFGSNLYEYIDGIVVGTGTISGTMQNPSQPFRVGELGSCNSACSGGNFDGNIDEFRVTKGIARYSGQNYTPALSPFGTTPPISSINFLADGVRKWTAQNDGMNSNNFEIVGNSSNPILAITSAGNVGIGTTAPSQMLEVNSGASGTSLIQINASNNVNGFKAGFLSGLGGVLGTSSFNILSLQTNNSEKMRIDGSGNVGIGTIITGNAGLSIMNGAVGIGTWVPASAFAIEGPDQTNSRIGTGSNTYYTQYGTVSGTPTNARAFVGLASGNHAVLQGGAGKDIYLYVNGATFGSGTIALAADVNGNVGIGTITPIGGLSVMNGNVGIGTWKPVGTLDLIGPQGAQFILRDLTSPTQNWSISSINGATNPELTFKQGNSQKMVINSAGNVGIGTILVGQALTIGGSASKIRMSDANGVSWSCGPAITTGVMTCTSP